MRAHWYRGAGDRNFGDALTRVLFARLAGVELTWSSPAEAQLFGAGSIAHRIPSDFTGVVWGTGYMWATQGGDLRHARVLAVRGPLSASQGQLQGCGGLLYADPGLLAGQLLAARPRARHRLGVVPHYADAELRKRWRGYPVDVRGGVERVVAQVATCQRVVTSSLHVLILADSLGIENRWEPSDAVIGHGHKFRDYAAAFGESIRPHTWRLADQAQVQAKAVALRAAMEQLR